MEDEKIVDLFWDRDESALVQTKRKYGDYCYSIAYHIVNNAEDAEECENDTYLGAWNSIPPQRPMVLKAYLAKIVRNLSLKKWRGTVAKKRGGGEAQLIFDELSASIPDNRNVEAIVEAKELTCVIEQFLKEQSVMDRRVFICRYWYFDSIAEISDQFGFSVSKTKSILFRTRKKLFEKLKEEELI